MALNTAAIQTAITNVIDGTFTGTRDITAGDYQLDKATPLKGLSIVTPTFDVAITGLQSHAGAPLSNSASRGIETLEIEIVLNYTLPPTVATSDRFATQASIVNAGNLVVQALTFPGNLADDGAGTPAATGIVGGLLTGPGGQGRPSITHSRQWDTLTATTTITAAAVVVVSQAVT